MERLDAERLAEHALLNRLQSVMLAGAMAGYLALVGWLLWGESGAWAMLLLAGLLVLFNPQVSPHLVLGLYRARALRPHDAPALQQAVHELARRAGLDRPPALFYVPSPILNAFAVGHRDQAALAVTDGLLRSLSWRELVAVLAHEMSHVQHNDMWVMGIADLFSRLTHLLSLFGQVMLLLSLPLVLVGGYTVNWLAIALLVLAPSLAVLTQLALSRSREYHADLNAVRLTGDPRGLASALTRLERGAGSWLERVLLPGRRNPDPSFLRTHPLTEERIRRLLELEAPALLRSDLFADPEHPQLPPHWHRPQHRPGWRPFSGLWH